MKREAELRRRLRSLEILGEAVGAMKSLSAHHFLEARRAVEPARTYRKGIDGLLAGSGAALPAGDGAAGLLVVGGELGLCGGYNARVVALGARRRSELGAGPTLCVGQRAAGLLARRGVELSRTYSAPTGIGGITDLLLRLADDVLTVYVAEELSGFEIVSSRFAGVAADRPDHLRLLPLEAARSGVVAAVRYASAESLASAVVREFLYITLYDLLLDALACEHGARLAATQSAESWLRERTDRLRRHLAATRREAGTQEVIEIAGGARARRRSQDSRADM